MTEIVLCFRFVFAGHQPAPPALENDAIHLHVALLAAGPQHCELLRLHKVFDDLTPARALIAATARAGRAGKPLAHAAVILHLAGSADGIRRPIIGGRIAVRMENLGLQVTHECLNF